TGKFPSASFAFNQAWLAASLTAATLIAWLRLLTLDGPLAKAEPKTLRYRILHAAARLTRGGRRRHLKIATTWPWAPAIVTAWDRIAALPHPPRPAGTIPTTKEGAPPGPVDPPAPAPPAGPPPYPGPKTKINYEAQPLSQASHRPP